MAKTDSFEVLDDPATIEHHARLDPALHIYELGDLDPFFWPDTEWFGVRGPAGLEALALLYRGAHIPTLLCLARTPTPAHTRLLAELAPRLPARLYAHFAPGLCEVLEREFVAESHGRHLKMVLDDHAALADFDADAVGSLDRANLDELRELYARSYPDNWFDPRMLDTGQYVGIRREGALVCVAGVHVYSPRYEVAGVGNVTTAPAWRGRGLARQAVAALCLRLSATCEVIGLNVHTDNAAAIACYRGLGFVEIARYDEYALQRI